MRKLFIILFLLITSNVFAADFNKVWINTILPHEGGYSNNIHDPGNWTGGKEGKGRFLGTKYGIAASVWGTTLLKRGIIIKHLTKNQARDLFQEKYWDNYYLGNLKSQGIAEEICDEIVNVGGGQTSILIDRVFREIEWSKSKYQPYKIDVPTNFKPETIEWINQYTEDRANRISFYNSLRMKRLKFYIALVHQKPAMRQFFQAWAERTCD